MLGRDPNERHRAATPLELLFDLTFVVSFAQSGRPAGALRRGRAHRPRRCGGSSFVLLSVCWAWINFTWFASAFDTDDWLQRILTMVQMVGVIVLALGIPAVFESIDSGEPFDFVVVAVGYVIMRVSLVLMWLRVARQDPANRRVALRYAVYNVLIQAGWLTVALLRIEDTALWSHCSSSLDRRVRRPPVRDVGREGRRRPLAGHTMERPAHLRAVRTARDDHAGRGDPRHDRRGRRRGLARRLERRGDPHRHRRNGPTFGLWWTYFILPSAPVLARHRERKWAWGYGHIVLFGSVAAVGAGLHVAAYAAEGETTIGTVGVVLAVAIPVFVFTLAYFVLWSILFRAVDAFHVALGAGVTLSSSPGSCSPLRGCPWGGASSW